MNKENILKFYKSLQNDKRQANYDIFNDECQSFLSEMPSGHERSMNQKQKKGSEVLKLTPICYFILSGICFLIALRHLPKEDKIYFFFDDPVSSDLSLIICMGLLCFLGVIIAQILRMSYSNKEIPFFQVHHQNRQTILTYNQIISYLGQFAHLFLLAEIVFQVTPSPLMRFEHEILLSLSITLNIIYLSYTTYFLHKAHEESYFRIVIYILYMISSILFLTQNFVDQFKLHYTYTFRSESLHIILPYVALLLQGCYFLMYYRILEHIQIQIRKKKQQNLEVF